MFKKFFIVLTICLGVFSSLAFASTNSDIELSSSSDKEYYIIYSNGNILYTDVISDYKELSTSIKYYTDVYDFYNASTGVTTYDNPGSIRTGTKGNTLITNHPGFKKFLSDLDMDGGSVNPPMISPTVEEAIQKIPSQFLTNLKTSLPVGVSILAILLGVSLIPRLKAWFL